MNFKFNKEPFLESIWEIRFDGINSFEVISGLLYEFLKNNYSELNIVRLPASYIPSEIVNFDMNLLFSPKILIEIKNTPIILQIGEKIINLNCKKPYIGWNNYSSEIKKIFNFLIEKKLIKTISKFSLRYINFLSKEYIEDLSGLNLYIKFTDWEIINENLLLKIEKEIRNYRYIIHILNKIFLNEIKENGIIIDIELELKEICVFNEENFKNILNDMHDNIKSLFFNKILKEEIFKKLI